ncbi:MAG: methionyl-tRNA formyltransferase [Acidimicrobiales bacterium]
MARLVYLGTPEAAVPPLRTLHAAGHDIALVVTRPDRRRGRRGAAGASPVKAAATGLGVPVTHELADVLGAGAELGVVVAYGRIIPAAVLARLPMVNVHFSLLPRWRGAAPVERAILAGDTETGVCLMEVAEGLDTGGIYASTVVPIGPDETATALRARLVEEGTALLVTHLRHGVAGLPAPRPQVGTVTYAEKLRPADLEIHWGAEPELVLRVIRLGRAWTTFRGRRLLVLAAEPVLRPGDDGGTAPGGDGGAVVPTGEPDSPAGLLVGDVVRTGSGGIRLLAVQPEGRRTMAAGDWVRGIRPRPGERLGR